MRASGLPAAVACALLLPACSAPGSGGADAPGIDVFAAASLRQAFTELAARYEQDSGSRVALTFAGSADLVSQLAEGARADVLATADLESMARTGAGGAVPFATNTMTVIVPPDNPAAIASLADLARPGVRLVVCAPQVPCGAAAQRVRAASGIDWRPVSEPNNVTDVVGAVASGEADAGVVYATDAIAAGAAVAEVPIPPDANTTTTAPIAALTPAGAGFAAYVAGPQGRSVLADAGFGPP